MVRVRTVVCGLLVGALLTLAQGPVLASSTPNVPPGTPGSSVTGSSVTGKPAPSFGSVPVPVYGQVAMRDGSGLNSTPFHLLVNGVQRLANSTALYFSIGTPTGHALRGFDPYRLRLSMPVSLDPAIRGKVTCSCFGGLRLIDSVHHDIYGAAIGTDGNAIASGADDSTVIGKQPGVFYVYYEVLPALPADVTRVDVVLGQGEVLPDVPVGNGALTPEQSPLAPVQLGSGWPKIDPAVADHSIEPERSIRSYGSLVESKDKSVVVRGNGEKTSVDLSADVLFTIDSSKLSGRALSRLRQAAASVNSGATGTVRIDGYTDNTGSTAHNVKLSKARARSVRAALQPLITVTGLRYAVAGRGERSPVASNSTSSGRKANRRVTISFVTKG